MWKRLDYADLQEILSYDEIEKLDTYSLSTDVEQICRKQLDSVADMFRGAWQAKGYAVDVRDHYVAPEYRIPVLNYARWQIWTRFPNTKDVSLDEPRQLAYEEAKELLANPYLATSAPDYGDDPDLSADSDLTATSDSAITVPYLRVDDVHSGFMRRVTDGK